MGVEVLVVVDEDSPERAAHVARAAFDAARAVDESLSDWTISSELRAVAAATAAADPGTPVPASPILADAVRRSIDMWHVTDGAFDCTAGPLVAIWRSARSSGAVPTDQEIAEARDRTGSRHLHADIGRGTVSFDRRGMSLDFGGIGKGIASGAALAAARAAGSGRTLVAVAGDVAAGAPPRGRLGWQVAIESGLGTLPPCVVWLTDAALSTSGDAEQVLVSGGARHSHIVDARTGDAVTQRIAPTVWSTDAAVADAAATSISVLGVSAMEPLCARIRASGVPIEMRIAFRERDDGPVATVATAGFPSCADADVPEASAGPGAPSGAAR
jgi:thiamine biosynthesis lipoprotein